jgi:hypothetical protein
VSAVAIDFDARDYDEVLILSSGDDLPYTAN